MEKLKHLPWYIWAGLALGVVGLVYMVWSNNQNNQAAGQGQDQSQTPGQGGGNPTPGDASGGYYGTPSGTDISGMLMDLQNEIQMMMNSAQNPNQTPAPVTAPPPVAGPPGPVGPPGPAGPPGKTPPPHKGRKSLITPPTMHPGGPLPGGPVTLPPVFHPAHAQKHMAAHVGGAF